MAIDGQPGSPCVDAQARHFRALAVYGPRRDCTKCCKTRYDTAVAPPYCLLSATHCYLVLYVPSYAVRACTEGAGIYTRTVVMVNIGVCSTAAVTSNSSETSMSPTSPCGPFKERQLLAVYWQSSLHSTTAAARPAMCCEVQCTSNRNVNTTEQQQIIYTIHQYQR